MDDIAWGWWFTGFVDGEGCFNINTYKKGRHRPRFIMKLRADDIAVLEKAQKLFGGSLRIQEPSRMMIERIPGTNPSAEWSVNHKRDLVLLDQHFQQFPPQSKKYRDYKIWTMAVREYIKTYPNMLKMHEYKIALEDIKIFQSVVLEIKESSMQQILFK